MSDLQDLDFDKGNGLLPAIVQDVTSNQVLMLGFMNKEALTKTQLENRVTFYSRSKQRLWTKGETSGNFFEVKQIHADCDNDTILIKAQPLGPACHTGSISCFADDRIQESFLRKLEDTIKIRKLERKEGSYTSQLFSEGLNKIAQKVGEEAVEVVIAAKDSDIESFKGEAADLLFHYLVLLQEKNLSLDDVIEVLRTRHK